jgi:hypothetical protein
VHLSNSCDSHVDIIVVVGKLKHKYIEVLSSSAGVHKFGASGNLGD